MLPSGADRIRAAAEQGIEFPAALRQALQDAPAKYGADYTGSEFSIEFNLGPAPIVEQINLVVRGNTVAADPYFDRLEHEFGWLTTHP
ncbi:MAG: hypothetical protein CMJ58_20895 [Planctomycetaceae bacterium]|nr:hypothetical protein [Planctomycetaceae bacterium]